MKRKQQSKPKEKRRGMRRRTWRRSWTRKQKEETTNFSSCASDKFLFILFEKFKTNYAFSPQLEEIVCKTLFWPLIKSCIDGEINEKEHTKTDCTINWLLSNMMSIQMSFKLEKHRKKSKNIVELSTCG